MKGCELLSFFVPLGWFTAIGNGSLVLRRLWIAFVLCTFGLIYSPYLEYIQDIIVVNCFRSLYLWVDLQPLSEIEFSASSCELLSFFVPLGWFTASVVKSILSLPLWIAFVLCTFGLIYSPITIGHFTTMLWIAFVLCTFGLIYSGIEKLLYWQQVVNCFRSLYLWVDLQRDFQIKNELFGCELLSFFVPLGWFTADRRLDFSGVRCELLSFFVPLGWFTAVDVDDAHAFQLWIAFVLCTFGLIYSTDYTTTLNGYVVNCFRSLYLWVDLQHSWSTSRTRRQLWIAFVLCTFGLIYSAYMEGNDEPLVVNCFRSLYLWVDLQRMRIR